MPTGNKGFGLIVAALLLALGVGQVRGADPSKPARPAAATSGQVSTPEPAKPAVLPASSAGALPSQVACSLVVNPPPAPAPPKCDEGSRLLASYKALYRGSGGERAFQFLVALVPDPEESGYADYFDAVFEGVEDAAAAGGPQLAGSKAKPQVYVRDHHYLPWPGSDASKRKEGCWEASPGVVLYRPSIAPESEPALVVLLVGETPTWGVRTEQLAAALSWIDREGQGDDPYRILGPTFSGTAPSLAAAIRRHVRDHGSNGASSFEFQLASGTATGDQVKPTLEGVGHELGIRVTYKAAIPDGQRLLGALTRFLESTAGGSERPLHDTVILSESGTAYGESVGAGGSAPSFQERRFPPNLASVRQAYAEVQKENPSVASTRAPSTAQVAPAEVRGELSEQTPISHDLELAELLRELSETGCRNIGLVATDARDVVFMAERIKEQLPDVRLFTTGFDLRYLHPDHASAMNGMLVAHAVTATPRGASSVLKNPMTRGVSDAGRYLLSGWPLVSEASVSLLGNGALWQIAGGGAPTAADIPRTFKAAYGISLFVALLMLLVVVGPSTTQFIQQLGRRNLLPAMAARSGFWRQRTPFWATLGNCEHLDLAADHAYATAALLTIALGAPAVMTAARLGLMSPAERSAERAGLWVLGLLTALGIGLIWWKTRGKFRLASRSALLFGLVASSLGCLSTSLGCAQPRQATFYLLSGGSPILGTLLGLAMLLLVVWCWRARLRLLDTLTFGALPGARFFEELPLPLTRVLGGSEQSELWELERRLLRILRRPWSSAPVVPLTTLALLALSIGSVFVIKPVLTFESGFRHWVLIGFVCLCIVPIVTSFARIVVTSRALMALLRSAACFPILEPLTKLPPELARRLETQLANGGREVGELRHAVRTLGSIAALRPDLAELARRCDRTLEVELAYEAGAPPSDDPLLKPQGPALLAEDLLATAASLATTPLSEQLQPLVAEYQARLFAIFVARYVRQLRLLVPPLIVGSLLAVLMTSLYFVQPQHMIASVCFVWITGMVLGVVLVYVELAADPVISAIGKTDAGSIAPSWSLAGRVFGVTLVPLASLLASQYPEFAFRLSSALGALGRVLH